MRCWLLGILAGVALTLLGAGCATDQGALPERNDRASAEQGQQSPQESPLPTPRETESRLPTTSPPKGPPSMPTDVYRRVRVVGTVVSGQEAACVEVEDANGVRWTLVGPQTEDLRAGERVSVTGMPRPEATGCSGPLVAVHRLELLD